jgi:hypothetical protein
MVISQCLSLTLSDIFVNYNEFSGEFCPNQESTTVDSQPISQEKRQREWIGAINQWHSAITSLQELLLSVIDTSVDDLDQGLVLSSPTPIISDYQLTSALKTGIFKVKTTGTMALMPGDRLCLKNQSFCSSIMELPLFINDPLREELFCLLFTPKFTLTLLLGKDKNGSAKFYFSFAPEIIKKVWLLLKSRLLITHHHQLSYLEKLIEKFGFVTPDYRLVSNFTRLLLKNISETTTQEHQQKASYLEQKKVNISQKSNNISLKKPPLPPCPEVELLQALTHEIRTPLTTIRTITKLLLKRAKLTPDLVKHLEIIDQECTEQINRMELIFRAAELETKPVKEEQVRLVPISLEQIFVQNIPSWKKQAKRRNVTLDIILPQKLPQIVSDPAILTQILTGLMEKFTRNIPSGGEIKVLISTAGNQLKLQFLPPSNYENNKVKSLGQFLLFQPDTGSLCLNLDVTKNIFHALGGKLIVRQKPKQGEILTVFLPLGPAKNVILKN